MKTRIQKWGDGLAVRIPKAFADEMGLRNGSPVDLSPYEGKLLITPAVKGAVCMDDLLAKVTAKNRHGEVDAGPATGREEW